MRHTIHTTKLDVRLPAETRAAVEAAARARALTVADWLRETLAREAASDAKGATADAQGLMSGSS